MPTVGWLAVFVHLIPSVPLNTAPTDSPGTKHRGKHRVLKIKINAYIKRNKIECQLCIALYDITGLGIMMHAHSNKYCFPLDTLRNFMESSRVKPYDTLHQSGCNETSQYELNY